MKKLIVVLMMLLVLAGCGKKVRCEICGQEKAGRTITREVFGEKLKVDICNDCYQDLKKLGELFD